MDSSWVEATKVNPATLPNPQGPAGMLTSTSPVRLLRHCARLRSAYVPRHVEILRCPQPLPPSLPLLLLSLEVLLLARAAGLHNAWACW